jgi:hypothetical protein
LYSTYFLKGVDAQNTDLLVTLKNFLRIKILVLWVISVLVSKYLQKFSMAGGINSGTTRVTKDVTMRHHVTSVISHILHSGQSFGGVFLSSELT